MNTHFLTRLLLIATLAIASHSAIAETTTVTSGEILVPVGSQSSGLQASTLPTHGQTMTDVLQTFGKPDTNDTIGTPPISRWSYTAKNMTVYFEGKRVLRTVVHHSVATP
ncbi:phosphodiesterase [Endozoicomonas ascidiicola]|uniref:phosphodiesterase n=1 Tax=Endozoicomonas ascidiicola TaxID=1698521 RepID=UPI000A4CC2E2|nr:phosphodiesterase [Endozoicomonas ascidiicola]